MNSGAAQPPDKGGGDGNQGKDCITEALCWRNARSMQTRAELRGAFASLAGDMPHIKKEKDEEEDETKEAAAAKEKKEASPPILLTSRCSH